MNENKHTEYPKTDVVDRYEEVSVHIYHFYVHLNLQYRNDFPMELFYT